MSENQRQVVSEVDVAALRDLIEDLSRTLHDVYQLEAKRQAGTGDDTVRHPDDYASLPEHTKEYDRVLARFILAREADYRREIEGLRERLARQDAVVKLARFATEVCPCFLNHRAEPCDPGCPRQDLLAALDALETSE